MYQYIFDNSTTQKINDSASKAKSVLEQFDEVDKKYSFGNTSDIALNLQRNNYVAPSEQEVKTQAENSLKNYKNESINKINNTYEQKAEQIDEKIKQVNRNKESEQNEIIGLYSQVKNNASNDAIKRGLARSSIIVNTLANHDNNMLNELSVLASKTNDQIASLGTQKNTLELEKANALNDFNIEYAVKLQGKIDTINQEIAKAEESAVKYNNEIAEIEAKWAQAQEEKNHERQTDLLEFVTKYGSYAIDVAKQSEKYAIAKNYFSNMSKDDALAELNNNSVYKESLGATNYKKLLEEISAR